MRRVILTGKIWEIRHWLKMYSKKYTFVSEWINDINEKEKQGIVYPFPSKQPLE